MRTFLIKDLLLFWRDRKEVLIVIVLPLILVIILSITMAGLFDDNLNENYDLTLGVVNEDDQAKSFKEFATAINQSQRIPEEEKQELLLRVQEAPPVELLTTFLNSPDLEGWMTVQTLSRSEAEELVENEELDAMLVIPENYTVQLLENIYLNQEMESTLSFLAKETAVEVDMIHHVINGFLDQMNLQYAIATSGGEVDLTQVNLPVGGKELMEESQAYTITINQYFTFSIGALFVLFMASTVASRTIVEKREHTFNRIVLTNTPALQFLFGKTFATFILSFSQILLVFLGSHIILGVFADRSLTFWVGLIVMALVYCLVIAGLSSILTSVALRLKNPDVVDGVFLIIIMVFGIIGGNFVPIYVLPNWLQQIGEWTPNGLTLAVLMEWFQFEDLSLLILPITVLLIITLISVMVSMLLYPRRGGIFMIPVFLAQLAKERRNPLILILLIFASIAMTIVFTGGTQAPTTVAIFSDEDYANPIEEKWEALLNEEGDIRFVITDPETAREDVQQGRTDLAIKLLEHDYQLITSSELPTIHYVDQYVRKVFEKEAFIHQATLQSSNPVDLRSNIETKLEQPFMEMEVASVTGDDLSSYDIETQLMFAFTLLVTMFVIGFRVNTILKDKVYGLWDRMILSPISKTSMYTGYMTYAFFIGFVQTMIVLLVFKYLLNYDIGDRLDLLIVIMAFFTFSMVSIATLITGFIKKPELFYAIYPSIIPIIPLISGAYMVPGTINNPVLTFIGDLFPLSHAMDAILGVVMYEATLRDIMQPLVLMLLIGVVAMGIGINLFERRKS